MPVKRASAVRTRKANVWEDLFHKITESGYAWGALLPVYWGATRAGSHSASCTRGMKMKNKNLCPFGVMINVVFNYVESLQQVLMTKIPLAVGTCHTVPLDTRTPIPWPLLIKIRGKNVNCAPATSWD